MKVKKILDNLFKEKSEVKTFDSQTLKLQLGLFEDDKIEVTVKVPTESVEKFGDAKKWSIFVKNSIEMYLSYLQEKKRLDEYDFDSVFNDIVITQYKGIIPIQ